LFTAYLNRPFAKFQINGDNNGADFVLSAL